MLTGLGRRGGGPCAAAFDKCGSDLRGGLLAVCVQLLCPGHDESVRRLPAAPQRVQCQVWRTDVHVDAMVTTDNAHIRAPYT